MQSSEFILSKLYKAKVTETLMQNNTENSQLNYGDNCLNEHQAAVISNVAINAPLLTTAIIGNALVLGAIFRTQSLRSPSIIFLCSLAISDLFVGLVVQPVFMVHLLKCDKIILQVYSILSLSAGGVSLATITAISVDRLLALQYHMRYPGMVTSSRAAYVSTSIWFFCLLLASLNLWSYTIHLFAVGFGIALCILISTFSYIKIYRIVCKHQSCIQAQQQAIESFNIEQKRHITRTTITALNTFIFYIFMLLCYLPVSMSALTKALYQNIWNVTWTFSDTIAFMISAINPFLYCWRVHELRTAVLKLLRNILRQTDAN